MEANRKGQWFKDKGAVHQKIRSSFGEEVKKILETEDHWRS